MHLPLACLPLGTWPTTQACALTGNWTSDPLVSRSTLCPLNYTSQGNIVEFLKQVILKSILSLDFIICINYIIVQARSFFLAAKNIPRVKIILWGVCVCVCVCNSVWGDSLIHFLNWQHLGNNRVRITRKCSWIDLREIWKIFRDSRNCGFSTIFRKEARLKKIKEKAVSEELGR